MSNILLFLLTIVFSVQSIYMLHQEGFACPDWSNSHNTVQSQNTNHTITNGRDNLLISTKNDSLFPNLFNFLTYANSTLGFRIDYPFDWLYNITGNNVIFRPAIGAAAPIQQESVKVSRGTNYSTYLIEPHLNFINNEQQDLFNNGSKLVVTPIIVSGQPAIKNQFISFRMQEGPCSPSFPMQQNITDMYVTDGNTIFTIEYKSGSESAMFPTIEKMLDSFEIIK